MRSTEIDGFWDSSWDIFWTQFWSWKLRLCQNREFLMADLTIWISGAHFIKIKSFFTPEGSIFSQTSNLGKYLVQCLDVILELEAEALSESRFLMADLTIWISGAGFIEMGEFLAEEGSIFLKLFWLKSAEIRDFSRQ